MFSLDARIKKMCNPTLLNPDEAQIADAHQEQDRLEEEVEIKDEEEDVQYGECEIKDDEDHQEGSQRMNQEEREYKQYTYWKPDYLLGIQDS